MSKYIDAEKLIKAIEDKGLDCSFALKMERLNTLALIDELQQEHTAKRGYKDCNGCEYNRLLKDQIGWQFRGCFGGDYKGKPIAEIELCPLKLAVQQEQPEVDLEKEVSKWWDASFPEPDFKFKKHQAHIISNNEIIKLAKYFYELGLKARKDE